MSGSWNHIFHIHEFRFSLIQPKREKGEQKEVDGGEGEDIIPTCSDVSERIFEDPCP